MSSIRPMLATDLLRLSSCNLDALTETYSIGFYLDYLARWPHLCRVIATPDGRIDGYILGKLEASPFAEPDAANPDADGRGNSKNSGSRGGNRGPASRPSIGGGGGGGRPQPPPRNNSSTSTATSATMSNPADDNHHDTKSSGPGSGSGSDTAAADTAPSTVAEYLPWHGHVTALSVAGGARRQGHARALTAALERESNARDAWFVDLFVRVENLPAQALYRKMGYSVYRRIFTYYSDGGDAFDMRKPLSRDVDRRHLRDGGETFLVDPSAVW